MLLWVESWKWVPCPEWNSVGKTVAWPSSLDWQLLLHLLSWRVVGSVNDRGGWASRMDAINEQSWLLPPPLPPQGESASQAKHSKSVCSREGHCNTICWWRLAWLWRGGTWRCELWLRPGLVSFRGHLGLDRVRVGCPYAAPLAFRLPSRLLRGVTGGDDWQQGAGQRRWTRKQDPQWEKRFFGGWVCFNAGLSCAAVLVHCCWQRWSLERCLALCHPALEKPCLTLLRTAGHTTAALAVATGKLSSSRFFVGVQQAGLPTAPLSYRIAHRGRAVHALPKSFTPAFLLSHLVSVSSWMHPTPQLLSPVIAQQHLFALLCTLLCFTEGEVYLHFASVFELWQGQKYGRWVGMRESGAWWICFSYLV